MADISFVEVPVGGRVPLTYIEFDPTRAAQDSGAQPHRLLIIGNRLSTGQVPELTLRTATNADEVAAFFGRGSVIHHMARLAFLNNKRTPTYFVALDDAPGSVASTSTFAVAGTPSQAGTVHLYVANRRYRVAVSAGQTATAIAAAIVALVQADPDRVVTASNVAGTVTFTARNKGSEGNSIDVRVNRFADEFTPLGLTLTITAASGGTANPDVAQVFAILGDQQFNTIACAWSDDANHAALHTELSSRFQASRQIEGVAITARRATQATLLTYGGAKNSQHVSCMGHDKAPSPSWEWAGGVAAVVAAAASDDPARGFLRLQVLGLGGPDEKDAFTVPEREGLLHDGISTFNVVSGVVQLERVITTYQISPAGADDSSYLDVATLYTLSRMRYDLRQEFALRYPRVKLANSAAEFGAGQVVLTPQEARGVIISLAAEWVSQGLMENLDAFKEALIVQRNSTDPSRLDVALAPDLVNQFLILGAKLQFLL